ncbi:MAG: DNA polymerase I [Candidatus Aminicenantes bacterium]|nr:DNA polymerase I [Candidatus Aminicenantes bacterium]
MIDGTSLLYRSYYAIQRLSTAGGFPTNAIYGFLTALRKILDEAGPGYLGIVFDAPGDKVRREVYADYKANRKPMPSDLAVQLPKLKEVLQAYRIPLLENSRYEADDVLGCLARRAAAEGFETVIVTTDKDLFQLVDGNTKVFNPAKDVLFDAKEVRKTFGVLPERVVDVLSLWGDPSDNIPGVPGIGEKTAKALIAEHGSLDALLAHPERIKNVRVREAVKKNRDKIELSRTLATIECGLEVDFDPAAFEVEEPDREALGRLLSELEFSSLAAAAGPKTNKARNYRTILEGEALKRFVAGIRKAGFVALDTETDNISPTRARLVGMSFALEPGEAFYLPLRHDYLGAPAQVPVAEAFSILRPVLEDPRIRKIGQNIKYDLIVLKREGIDLQGLDEDTMILSYLLEPNWGRHNLDRLAAAYLQETAIPFHEVVGKGKNEITMNRAPVEAASPYACQDADFALSIAQILRPRLETEKLAGLYRDLERPLIPILAGMEIAGVRVDEPALRAIAAELAADLGRLEKQIFEQAGREFNINSPAQLSSVLFQKLLLQPPKKSRGAKAGSTAIEVLEELKSLHPVVPLVIDYRQTAKLKSTYADALPELIDPADGRIHTSYNQAVTSTGRLSSSDPNLQNIPARGPAGKRFRRAFIPGPGCLFLAADYSQIELRVLAHLSEDPVLIDIFSRDHDIHAETADRVFGPESGLSAEERRHRAKIINFSLIYGASAFSLARELGASNREAQDYIDRYYERFPGVKAYLDQLVEDAAGRGYVETMFGRRRQVPELRQPDRTAREAGRRMALNTPIQGTAADIMKKAMIDIHDGLARRTLGARMILQVHDELVLEVPEKERRSVEDLVREAMESVCPGFRVPMKATLGWGENWADAK